MRVAWFHPAASDSDATADDDVRRLVDELRATCTIDLFDETRADQFPWRHARDPYDLCVYELADTPAHQYVWPYLLHVPGVVALGTTSLRHSRSLALARERRDDDARAELAFSGEPMTRAPLSASRLVVVFDAALARALEEEYPGISVAVAPVGVSPVQRAALSDVRRPVRFAVLDGTDIDIVERAAHRARAAGAELELTDGRPIEDAIRNSDVAIALEWPPTGAPPRGALVAMGSGVPTVVLETVASAAWPALDPQTWQSRDPIPHGAPVVVSLDPRDDEHSLVLAMRRLSADADLRQSLGTAARSWWREHATVGHAAAAWHLILERAVTLDPPALPPGWPPHLTADGTERAREILDEFGLTVDFLQKPPTYPGSVVSRASSTGTPTEK